jgi:hypothetical protein
VTGLELSGARNTEYKGIAGDIGALAPLTQLTTLNLDETNVAGDLHGLAPLVKLTELNLYATNVDGNLQAVVPMVELKHLGLSNTRVSGRAEVLAPLHLTNLRLLGSAVTGCDAVCERTPRDGTVETTVRGCSGSWIDCYCHC